VANLTAQVANLTAALANAVGSSGGTAANGAGAAASCPACSSNVGLVAGVAVGAFAGGVGAALLGVCLLGGRRRRDERRSPADAKRKRVGIAGAGGRAGGAGDGAVAVDISNPFAAAAAAKRAGGGAAATASGAQLAAAAGLNVYGAQARMASQRRLKLVSSRHLQEDAAMAAFARSGAAAALVGAKKGGGQPRADFDATGVDGKGGEADGADGDGAERSRPAAAPKLAPLSLASSARQGRAVAPSFRMSISGPSAARHGVPSADGRVRVGPGSPLGADGPAFRQGLGPMAGGPGGGAAAGASALTVDAAGVVAPLSNPLMSRPRTASRKAATGSSRRLAVAAAAEAEAAAAAGAAGPAEGAPSGLGGGGGASSARARWRGAAGKASVLSGYAFGRGAGRTGRGGGLAAVPEAPALGAVPEAEDGWADEA